MALTEIDLMSDNQEIHTKRGFRQVDLDFDLSCSILLSYFQCQHQTTRLTFDSILFHDLYVGWVIGDDFTSYVCIQFQRLTDCRCLQGDKAPLSACQIYLDSAIV